MGSYLKNKLWKQSSLKKILAVLIVIIILIGGITITVVSSIIYNTLSEDVISAYENVLTSEIDTYSDQISNMDDYFLDYMSDNSIVLDLSRATEELTYSVARTQMVLNLNSVQYLYPFVYFYYCYIPDQEDIFYSSSGLSQSISYEQRTEFTAFIKSEEYQSKSSVGAWSEYRIGDKAYLIRAYHHGSTEVGACILLSDLFPSDSLLADMTGSVLCFTDEENTILTAEIVEKSSISKYDLQNMDDVEELLSGNLQQTQITVMFDVVGISLTVYLDSSQLFSSIYPVLITIIVFILAVFLLVSFLMYYLFVRYVYRPILSMQEAVKKIAQGNLDVRLSENERVLELSELNRQFNNMTLQMTTLKISLYEEKIRLQESQLEQLRLQLNPHLLLNSLNLIYTMTRQKHYDVAQEFNMCLIRHFRYVLKKNHNFVPIAEEIKFSENYMRIAKLQYPDYFEYDIRNNLTPERMKETVLPSLIIENLVENSIKYGLLQEKVLHVLVLINEEDWSEKPMIRVTVADDGPGFLKEDIAYFESLADGSAKIDKNRRGIGIQNLIIRLTLLYEGNASIFFANEDGAKITIVFPYTYPLPEKET